MNLEDFRKNIELKLSSITEFELQEFHFLPYTFGSGFIVYRIKGYFHKFIFDGRECELTWLISKQQHKYSDNSFTEFKRFYELDISDKELENGIKNSA